MATMRASPDLVASTAASTAPLEQRDSSPLGSHPSLSRRLVDTLRNFADLGFTAFGGPGVHVVILRRRFVDKLRWVDDRTFVDLFALGNALPGPGSTQLAFSIATVHGGTLSGFLAFLLWSVPGAVGMTALGAGVRSFPAQLPPIVLALLTGLNAAAVGLIALAAYQLANGAITDTVTRFVLLLSASFGICYHAPWMYPTLIVAGGLSTLTYDYRHKLLDFWRGRPLRSRARATGSDNAGRASIDNAAPAFDQDVEHTTASASDTQHSARQLYNRHGHGARHDESATAPSAPPTSVNEPTPLMVPSRKAAIAFGSSVVVMLVTLLAVRARLSVVPRELNFTTNMVIAGIIIFGGGPVVVPLLRGYTVDNGWVASRDFLLGFAILQAFPGPNFNFAAYLGILACPDRPVLGALLGWFGIFSPGILIKLALLPLYHTWRRLQVAKSVLRGLNAAASGLVFTAVWQLFLVGFIYQSASGQTTQPSSGAAPLTSDPWWGVVAAWAFVLTHWCRVPAALTVILGALAGMAWFGVVGAAGTTLVAAVVRTSRHVTLLLHALSARAPLPGSTYS